MNWKARFEFRIVGLLEILSQNGTDSTLGSILYRKEL